MHRNLFFNTKYYLKTIVKKDIMKILIWILSISAFVIAVGFAYPALFPNPEELVGLAEAMNNPVMVAMFGPVFDYTNYTTAIALGNQMLLFSMMFSAIMSIFIVSRMTRGDEEDGILELIRSMPLGRLTHIFTTLIIVVVMNLILSLIIGLGLSFIPDDSITFIGSMTYGLSIGTAGILMASITLIISQLFESNRTVMGVSFLVLGLMYILRGAGDLSNNFLVWAIPLNWPLRVEVYIQNRNWLNILTLLLSIFLFLYAFRLNAKRDIQSGLMPQKKGKTEASKQLKTPLGFVLKLLKPGLITWAITVFILGLTYGSIFGDLDTFIEGSDIFEQMLPGGQYPLNVQFMSIIMMVVAITAGIGPIMFLNRLASEEKKNHTEHIYSTSISRQKMMLIFSSISIITSILFLFIGALGMLSGIVYSMDDPISSTYIFQAGFAYLPAILFTVGLTTLIIGFYPEKTYLIWIFYGYSFFAVYMGNVIGLPEIFSNLTPFGYINQLPIETFNILPSIILIILTGVFIFYGFVNYKKRDLIG